MAEQAFDLMACLKGYDERIRQLEASKNPGFAHVRTAKRTVDDGNGVTHEESFSYQPRFSIADRDAKIKGLEAELEAQRMHYQGELEKARKAVDALASEHIREHKRRIEIEDTISGLQGELNIANAQLRDLRLRTGFEGRAQTVKCLACGDWFSLLEIESHSHKK
jgi:chromosome segregation ATPase